MVDVQIVKIKRVYGLSGCHRAGLVFLVRPEFLLDVGSAQGGQAQARQALGYIKELASSFSLGLGYCGRGRLD